MTQDTARIYRVTWLPAEAVETAYQECHDKLARNPMCSLWDFVESCTLETERVVVKEESALGLALELLPRDYYGEVHISRERRVGRYDWEQEAYAIVSAEDQKTLDWIEND